MKKLFLENLAEIIGLLKFRNRQGFNELFCMNMVEMLEAVYAQVEAVVSEELILAIIQGPYMDALQTFDSITTSQIVDDDEQLMQLFEHIKQLAIMTSEYPETIEVSEIAATIAGRLQVKAEMITAYARR